MKTKLLYAALAIIIAIIAAPMLMSPPHDTGAGKPVTGLPWQIEVLPDGTSSVSGLTLGASTMTDARTRFGDGELAMVAAPGEPLALEFYFNDVTFGVVTGKLIATADLPDETLAAMRQRATRTEYMKSDTKKSALADEDLPAAFAAPIRALAFVPSINLDEEMIVQRFGQPAERVKAGASFEHFLYPDRGLDIRLDSEAKEVLQYVAPKDFSRLRAPLKTLEAKP